MGKMLRPLKKKKRVIIDQTSLDNWRYKLFLFQALTLKLSEKFNKLLCFIQRLSKNPIVL